MQEWTPVLISRLLEVWVGSVRATHLFLSDGEIKSIKEYVPQALPPVLSQLGPDFSLTLKVIVDENYPASYAPVIVKMGNISAIETVTEKDPAAAAFIVKTTQYFVPLGDNIDREAETKRLTADLEYLEGFLASVMKKLSNERFVNSAPEKVVANERAKKADAEAKIAAIREQLSALK